MLRVTMAILLLFKDKRPLPAFFRNESTSVLVERETSNCTGTVGRAFDRKKHGEFPCPTAGSCPR